MTLLGSLSLGSEIVIAIAGGNLFPSGSLPQQSHKTARQRRRRVVIARCVADPAIDFADRTRNTSVETKYINPVFTF
jgi:hypothetical protein